MGPSQCIGNGESGRAADLFRHFVDPRGDQLLERRRQCLGIVGGRGPRGLGLLGDATGLAALNDRLSGLRADYIKDRLEDQERSLRGRILATGKGSREMIVGTGKDDASDALDRRVEFNVAKCSI